MITLYVEISGDVCFEPTTSEVCVRIVKTMLPMRDEETTTSEDRATQLLICEKLSLAISYFIHTQALKPLLQILICKYFLRDSASNRFLAATFSKHISVLKLFSSGFNATMSVL